MTFSDIIYFTSIVALLQCKVTGGKFATGVNDAGINNTSGKFDWYQRHWWQILPPVPFVLLTQSVNDTSGKFAAGVNNAGNKFVIDTGGK